MKIEHETPFPTVGEVIQAVFGWSGLWDYVVDQARGNDEARKNLRKQQKKLQRQASEEYLTSFDELGVFVSCSLHNALRDDNLCQIAGDCTYLLLRAYIREVLENCTWMGRKATARWYLSERALLPLVVTSQRFSLMGCLGKSLHKLTLPDDDFWYLPSRDKDKKWVTPVQKTVRWWMKSNGFSSPEQLEGRIGKPGLVRAVTIRSWVNGDSVPELTTLRILADADLKLGPDEQANKNSLLTMILVCRLVQGFGDVIKEILGEKEAVRLLRDYRVLCRAFERHEKKEFVQFMNLVAAKAGMPLQEMPVEIVMEAKELFLSKEITKRAIGLMTEVQKRGTFSFITGSDFVQKWARILWKNSTKDLDDSVKEAVWSACELAQATRQNHRFVRRGDFERLLANFKQKTGPGVKLECYLLAAEARGTVCAGDFEKAFESYVRAFKEARYQGGRLTEKICEELIGLACFMYSRMIEHESPRGKYWPVAKYLRGWCKMMGVCGNLLDDDDAAFVKKGRLGFMKLMGVPEVG